MADQATSGTDGKLDVAFTPDPGTISDGSTGGALDMGSGAGSSGSMAGGATGSGSAGSSSGSTGSGGVAETATTAVKSLGSQATEQVRTLADTGKTRATGALGEFATMLDDAAAQVDEKLGPQFGGYARQASGAVRSFADGLDGKDVDDIVEDVRAFVQKSPAVAIGTAAALGFVVARVLRAGVDANRA